jgi:hypothetical protein
MNGENKNNGAPDFASMLGPMLANMQNKEPSS